MYLPDFWWGYLLGAVSMFVVLFVMGLFVTMVNARNERVALDVENLKDSTDAKRLGK